MEISGEVIIETKPITPSFGSAGLITQLSGSATTFDCVAAATGGIGEGNRRE